MYDFVLPVCRFLVLQQQGGSQLHRFVGGKNLLVVLQFPQGGSRFRHGGVCLQAVQVQKQGVLQPGAGVPCLGGFLHGNLPQTLVVGGVKNLT